ncbi:hypothetical protein [Guptibacillus sedimenti]|uniref:hypothetical protein n=1 Tax=Guptibacillus sedimenti TaxID=3025680 RepID=UPI0023620A0E|nr:hypothetical protein [Pseudalkalibacillus sedimenti]
MTFLMYFIIFFVVFMVVKGVLNLFKGQKMDRITVIGGLVLALIYSIILTIVKG